MAKWLEHIVREEKKRKLKILAKPTANVLQLKKTYQVGTPTDKVTVLDKQYMEDECNFEKRVNKMQQRQEVASESRICFLMQHFDCQEIESLLGKIIDYLHEFDNKGEPDYELCWCQGKAIEVGESPKKPNTVKVRWDPMINSDRYNDCTESTVNLLPFLEQRQVPHVEDGHQH